MSIAWDDSLAVGDPALDSDHRHMVELIAALESAALAPFDPGRVSGLLTDLLDHCRAHFVREETVMHRVGFPGLEDHRLRHDLLRRRLEGLVAHYGDSPDEVRAEILRTLGDSLATWMIGHVTRCDRDYRPFLPRA